MRWNVTCYEADGPAAVRTSQADGLFCFAFGFGGSAKIFLAIKTSVNIQNSFEATQEENLQLGDLAQLVHWGGAAFALQGTKRLPLRSGLVCRDIATKQDD